MSEEVRKWAEAVDRQTALSFGISILDDMVAWLRTYEWDSLRERIEAGDCEE